MSSQGGVKPRLTPKRTRETPEYLGMVRRMLRAAGRRVGDGDEVDLADLVALREDLDRAIELAVIGQKRTSSWAYIAQGLGTTRQAAQMRYAKACRDA